jgi:hypothetical protein
MRVRSLEHDDDDETRARADPARSHPIERSRRTELNAERVLLLDAPRRRRRRRGAGQNRDKPDRRPRTTRFSRSR